MNEKAPHVVIVGAGFAGLECAKRLAKRDVRITLVDRTNHHLFQPLLYQVASAGLSPADIAVPIRGELTKYRNLRVLLGEVTDVRLAEKVVVLGAESIAYDTLVLATGAETSYFGNDSWARHSIGLKSLDDALRVRESMLLAFEAAERTDDEALRARLLTFVVIGGGPTGVEMAGAFAELARRVLASDFRAIDPAKTRVLLIEAGPKILPAFAEELSVRAKKDLERLGVDVRVSTRVSAIEEHLVRFEGASGAEQVAAQTVVWAAGVRASKLLEKLGAQTDRGGRVVVEKDFSLPGHPEVFVVGDASAMVDAAGVAVPGLSPAAMQGGRFVADAIAGDISKRDREGFRYFDKGIMATIGRSSAIAQTGKLRLTGLLAWLAWSFVHVIFLVNFRNRVVVVLEWIWQYVTWKRGARLITHPVSTPSTIGPVSEKK